MIYLVLGLALWSAVHFVPSLGLSYKKSLQGRIGPNAYRGLFSILILLSVALIVLGWRSSIPSPLYYLPGFAQSGAIFLLVVAFILLGAANYKTRIKRVIRHPQLTGVALWSTAHLLLNGDTRSVLLFGTLGVWAVLEIVFINKRDGEWVKPPAPSWAWEVVGVLISLVVFAVVVYLHPYFAGVPVRF